MKKKMLFVIATIVAFALFVPSVMAAEKVAKIGETEYETLAEAIAAVGSETTTITLTSDVELDARFDIPSGKTVILDMAGYSMDLLLVEDNYASVIKGNLTIKGDGNVNIPGPYGIYVTGTLIIENGTFNQPEGVYLIFNTNNVTINGGIFYADYCAVNGYRGNSIVINDGEFYGNEPELIVGEIPVTVNGGVFNQDVAACKFENEAGEEVYCLSNDAEDEGVELVSITMVSIIGEETETSDAVYFVKGYELSDEELEELDALEDEINEMLKEAELEYVFKGIYEDKDGKNEVDFTKPLESDATWYLLVEEVVAEELPPKTSDINLAVLIGTILVGIVGTAIVSKKRFAKSN